MAQTIVFLALRYISSLPAAVTIWKPPTIINITAQMPMMPKNPWATTKNACVKSCSGRGLYKVVGLLPVVAAAGWAGVSG